MCSTDCFLALLALIFPPLAVWVKRGIFSADSVINILLCVLGYLPGLIHAWYIIAKFPDPGFDYEVLGQDTEAARVTYVVVQPGHIQSGNGSNSGSGDRRGDRLASSSHHVTTTSVAGDSNVPSPAAASAAPKIQENMNYGATSSSSAARSSAPPTPTPAHAAGPSRGGDFDAGEGSSDAPPPSYAQTVAGDNKIQSQD